MLGGAALFTGLPTYGAAFTSSIQSGKLTVTDAYTLAIRGDITLVDIRRPDEWAHYGVGEGAIPIDLRDPKFTQKLLTHISGKDAPVALICARGVRSRGFSRVLRKAGFTNIIDVPEGMLGSGDGPGWIKTGLPIRRV
ncbi:MAG: rhodanese-like domain-containing protein [Sulfitobacter sp.]